MPKHLIARPLRGSVRIAASLVRKHVPMLAVTTARFSQSRVEVDLRTSLGLHLYRYPFLVDPEIQVVLTRLQPGDVFVDGGANIGLFTMAAAERVGPTGRVIAVEPGPVHCSLERNKRLNGYEWVDVHRVALGSATGSRQFMIFDGDAAGLSSFSPSRIDGHFIKVEVRRIDDLVPRQLLDRVRLVKLDLEGAEVDALRGATNLLAETDADFLVEVESSHLARQGATEEDLLQIFKDFDQHRFPNSPNRLFLRRH